MTLYKKIITRSIFKDLQLWMVLFGFFMGLIFPFFLNLMLGVPSDYVMTPIFFAACIIAGFFLGILNFGLVRLILGARFQELIGSMKHISTVLQSHRDDNSCGGEECRLSIKSDDEIGEAADTFNNLISSLQRRNEFESQIRLFTYILNEYIEIHQLGNKIVENFIRISEADAGLCLIYEKETWEKVAFFGINDDEAGIDSLSKPGGLISKMTKTKEPVFINLPDEIPVTLSGIGFSFKPKYFVLYPILYHDTVIGMFMFVSVKSLGEQSIAILNIISSHIGNAFQNSLLHSRLKEIAVIDELTSAYNRRFGMQRLSEEFSRAARNGTPLSIIMSDIDFFKAVNDTYGHQAGDMVLKKVSHILKSNIREGDILCRYGGEEFITILPGSSLEDAAKLTERLRRIIETTEYQWENDISIKISSSFGVATCDGSDICDEMKLIQRADMALYNAKESGRNCVKIAK